jgi:fructokinase
MLTVLGETVVDLAPHDGGELFVAHPGGSPLNVAVGLARLGHPTAMMARFSTGGLGERLRAHAVDNDVDLTPSVYCPRPATLAVVSLDEAGAASYDFYLEGTADWHWSDEELAALPAATRVLHTGSLACLLSPGADRIGELVARLHAAGNVLISFDPNLRPQVLDDPRSARDLVTRLAAHTHVIKASDEDLRWLYPDETAEAAARRLHGIGAALVVVTLGAGGSLAVTGTATVRCPARPVEVVDTVGAGDAFTAGLLSALVEADSITPDRIAALDAATVSGVLEHAALVAALTCARPGADPPSRAEVTAARGA